MEKYFVDEKEETICINLYKNQIYYVCMYVLLFSVNILYLDDIELNN